MSNPDYLKMIAGLCDAMKRLEWAVSTSGADRKSYMKDCKRKRSLVEDELVKAAGQKSQSNSDSGEQKYDISSTDVRKILMYDIERLRSAVVLLRDASNVVSCQLHGSGVTEIAHTAMDHAIDESIRALRLSDQAESRIKRGPE